LERIIGIETEYGILAPNAKANPMQLSSLVVGAYRDSGVPWAAWDYSAEDPLCDARGFHLERAAAHPSQLTHVPRPAMRVRGEPTAIVLPNGARFYVDHAHPEYSAPETSTARQAALWDKAGEAICLAAIQHLPTIDIGIYKNNTDGKGASYGMHENYLVDRLVPFDDLVAFMVPFLVTRQIYAGSGRVGLGQHSQDPGFQLSQRADFIEAIVGLETTMRRPIINTRDEPHADPTLWRRLHVIVGDATMLEVATYLRVGTTALALTCLEACFGAPDAGEAGRGAAGPGAPSRIPDGFLDAVRLADPVAAFRQVSRDTTISEPLALAAGGHATAIEIQRRYLALAKQITQHPADGEVGDLLGRWESVLDRLGSDPLTCAGDVEWVAKYRLLSALAAREPAGWAAPKVAAADLQWTDIRPDRSLAARLMAAGAVETLFTPEEVAAAVATPPPSTRAHLRGRAVATPPGALAANWDSVTLHPPADAEPPIRLEFPDPWVALLQDG
jgi:proteasome accessory factor A